MCPRLRWSASSRNDSCEDCARVAGVRTRQSRRGSVPWVSPRQKPEGVTFYDAAGCEQCRQTGYRGRIGIYEIMSVTDEIRRLIARKVTGAELCAAARAAGMRSLGEDGLLKVKAGLTTPEELLRVVTDVRKSDGACSKCGSEVEPDFMVCPACGHHLGGGCSNCGRAAPARLEVLSLLRRKHWGDCREAGVSSACTAAARRPVDQWP